MTVAIAWLRSSFRLDDQPMLTEAARDGDELLIVAERSAGPRAGPHRATFHTESLRALEPAERFAPWRAALPPKDYPRPLIDDRRWP